MVDVLNYVMLELGQPLHAFDRAAITGGIRVRLAHAGETLTLLNGATATPAPDMLLIADDNGPLALAGVMGGATSAVGVGTTGVFLESAWFAPAAIRGRARRLGLATDAAQRYERGVDPELARAALERASKLIAEITGGSPGPVISAEALEHLPSRPEIAFHRATLPRLIGLELDHEEVERTLAGLGFALKRRGDAILATPPSARFDIEGESDLAEEIVRIIGFENIPAVAPRRRLALPRAPRREGLSERLATLLVARGYDEAVTMSSLRPIATPRSRPRAVRNSRSPIRFPSVSRCCADPFGPDCWARLRTMPHARPSGCACSNRVSCSMPARGRPCVSAR